MPLLRIFFSFLGGAHQRSVYGIKKSTKYSVKYTEALSMTDDDSILGTLFQLFRAGQYSCEIAARTLSLTNKTENNTH